MTRCCTCVDGGGDMRGSDETAGSLFSYGDPEKRVRRDHPLRVIRGIVNETLITLLPEFDARIAGGVAS